MAISSFERDADAPQPIAWTLSVQRGSKKAAQSWLDRRPRFPWENRTLIGDSYGGDSEVRPELKKNWVFFALGCQKQSSTPKGVDWLLGDGIMEPDQFHQMRMSIFNMCSA
jgi:hypothetical protein